MEITRVGNVPQNHDRLKRISASATSTQVESTVIVNNDLQQQTVPSKIEMLADQTIESDGVFMHIFNILTLCSSDKTRKSIEKVLHRGLWQKLAK